VNLSQSHCDFISDVKSSCHLLIPFLPYLQLPIPRLLSTTVVYSAVLHLLLLLLSKSELCYNRRSAGHCVLEQSTHLGLMTRSWLLSDRCGFVDLGRPLSLEDGSAVCNCYWSSPAQSFSGPSPVGLLAIFYCLRFETSLFITSYDSQGHGGGIRPRLHCRTLLIITLHKPCTENMSRDHHPASPLARWLLPSNGLIMDLQKTCHVTVTHSCVTSPRTQKKHCSSIIGRVCVFRALHSKGFTCHNIINHKIILAILNSCGITVNPHYYGLIRRKCVCYHQCPL
jgi:hypothetical protein